MVGLSDVSKGPREKTVISLATSLDGKTLYYTTDGNVWSIPADDGTPNKICAGDGVAVDLNGKDLLSTCLGRREPSYFGFRFQGIRERKSAFQPTSR